ncbi:glycosyltransferase family 4 protein [Microbacterium kribbense]|uniref:glycosyltransferase family 4 protein n=1 Tax=Microbacterium kribbense TaxID=433645 RepID=UPI0031D56136
MLAIDHTAGLAGGEVALARLLAEIDRVRFTPSVVLLEDGPLVQRLREASVRTAVLPTSRALTTAGRADVAASPLALLLNAARTAMLIPRLSAAIRGAGADLVVANSLKAAVITALAAPLAGRPWVWHLHDRIARDYLPGVLVRALRLLARVGPRMVVVNSEATGRTLPNMPAGRTVVVYPAVPDTAPIPPRSPATPTFGLLGRIAPTKGQLEFVHAAAELARTMPDARFEILGDAMFNDHVFADEVRTLPRLLGIEERVTFAGWVDDPAAALAGLTALIHASPVPEPFGQVVIEGMLAGVPVIATAAGGVPEIVDPDGAGEAAGQGVTRTPYGLLIPPGDVAAMAAAMAWVVAHPVDAAHAAARAQTMARARFDIAISAARAQDAWAHALR